jgi:hypothetical protein
MVRWRSEAAEEFWWPVMRVMRSYSMIEPRGMRGDQRRRATMAEGGSSPNGTISGDGVPPAADHRQKARG